MMRKNVLIVFYVINISASTMIINSNTRVNSMSSYIIQLLLKIILNLKKKQDIKHFSELAFHYF